MTKTLLYPQRHKILNNGGRVIKEKLTLVPDDIFVSPEFKELIVTQFSLRREKMARKLMFKTTKPLLTCAL